MLLLVVLVAIGGALGRLQTMARNTGRDDIVSSAVQRAVMPLARPLARACDTVRDFSFGVVHAPSLQARNRLLQEQVEAMALYQERVDLLDQQIDVLRNQVGLGLLPGHQRINLDVVGFAQNERTLTLDGGSELGIEADMPVINGEGLVGIVDSVSKGWSRVALITNYGINFGGIDVNRKPPEVGFLKGQGATMLNMTMLDPKSPIKSGDRIVTSGLSQHVPYGLIIGRVISVEDDPEIGTRRATVDPAVNVGLLREVQVLK